MNTNLRTVAPGILCSGTNNIVVHDNDHTLDFIIEPEKNSTSTIYFTLPENMIEKKFQITVNFHFENAHVEIFGLYQTCKKQNIEIKTNVNHFISHCYSKQIWRGVLNDSSKALFEGKIFVAEHAQKTDAQLSNKNLLLSNEAQINTKPILEIYADDVKCTHGATVGCLDQEALFYLRSRGVFEADARAMLIEAFVSEVLV